jgi:hypothetical protein
MLNGHFVHTRCSYVGETENATLRLFSLRSSSVRGLLLFTFYLVRFPISKSHTGSDVVKEEVTILLIIKKVKKGKI